LQLSPSIRIQLSLSHVLIFIDFKSKNNKKMRLCENDSYMRMLQIKSRIFCEKCTVYGPWSASKNYNLEHLNNLNILPESKRSELKFFLKIAFMFLAIILNWPVPS